MPTLQFLPEEIIALQQELKNHPEILDKLKNLDLADSFGSIAADLGILLDGDYDVPDLCKLLLKKLQERSSIIFLNSPGLVDIKVKEGPDTITIQRAKPEPLKSESK